MKCSCKDWTENIDKLDSSFLIQELHGLGGYTGKLFEFCPWCGKKADKYEPKTS